ncbi:hypothetical protein B0H66DRAFT_62045 [Apodospora peruviana]|uniref:Uncharacterized protein n=1 Tax=Apodospora peruviana TaxID=516989 RepID=A0AAE0MFA4_9PEZI|nr:hypothetical protein B0H66DRAFT_62045 [Apodospora peruviana]
MLYLTPYTALLLIEHVDDVETLTNLMCTCKEMCALCRKYEHHITKTIVNSRMGSDGHLLPLTGTVLSTYTYEREVMEPYSFSLLRELDMRRHRVDLLFKDGGAIMRAITNDMNNKLSMLWRLELDKAAILVQKLKGACMLVDRLSDCVADVQHLDMISAAANPNNNNDENTETDDPDTARALREKRNNKITRKSQWAQRRFLQSLAPIELAYLHALELHVGHAYIFESGGKIFDNDEATSVTAVQEVFLRQGSLALQAWFLAGDVAAKHQQRKSLTRHFIMTLEAMMEELRRYENGQALAVGSEDVDDEGGHAGVLPGLQQIIVSEFVRKVGSTTDRAWIKMNRMILADIGD